jgi:hypothetical protein
VADEGLVIAHLKKMPVDGVDLRPAINADREQGEDGQMKTVILDSL